MTSDLQEVRVKTALRYFSYIDSSDIAVLELFVEDPWLFFPKFGIVKGTAAIASFMAQFGTEVVRIAHDVNNFNIMHYGRYLVVEGSVSGNLSSGAIFPDGLHSFGMFCNVFEFEGELIKRVSIYEDPDFGGGDADRIAWANGSSLADRRKG